VNACCLDFIDKRCDKTFQSTSCLAIREHTTRGLERPVGALYYFGTGFSLKSARRNAKLACFLDPQISFSACSRHYTLVSNECPSRRLLQDIILSQNNSSMATTSQRRGESAPLLFTGFIVARWQ